MHKLKQLFIFFTLFVFLSSFVEKEVHTWLHDNDVHCTSQKTHFHEQEHHCGFCDFKNDFTGSHCFYQHSLLITETDALEFFFSEPILLLQQKYFHSLRAPPFTS